MNQHKIFNTTLVFVMSSTEHTSYLHARWRWSEQCVEVRTQLLSACAARWLHNFLQTNLLSKRHMPSGQLNQCNNFTTSSTTGKWRPMPCLFVKCPYRQCCLSNLLSNGASSLGIKLPAREADQLRLCSAENDIKCNCNSTSAYLFIVNLLSTETIFSSSILFWAHAKLRR